MIFPQKSIKHALDHLHCAYTCFSTYLHVNASRDHDYALERHFELLKHVNACILKLAMGLLECNLHLKAQRHENACAMTLGECDFALYAWFWQVSKHVMLLLECNLHLDCILRHEDALQECDLHKRWIPMHFKTYNEANRMWFASCSICVHYKTCKLPYRVWFAFGTHATAA